VEIEIGTLHVPGHVPFGETRAVTFHGSLERRPASRGLGGENGATAKASVAAALIGAGLCPIELSVLEAAAINNALHHSSGNRTHAAKSLGISVRTLQRKIKTGHAENLSSDGRFLDENGPPACPPDAYRPNGLPRSSKSFQE